MIDSDFLSDKIIGQQATRTMLSMYNSSFRQTSISPFFLAIGPRGGGKTKLMREYIATMEDPMGRPRELIEVNGSSMTSVANFYDCWYPQMRDKNGILFIDEAHKIHPNVQAMLLTVCEKKPSPIRRYNMERREEGFTTYHFDFRDYGIFFATTDQQLLSQAFRDRTTPIILDPYTDEELYKIMLTGLNEGVVISESLKPHFMSIMRGHPRSAIEYADKLNAFTAAMSDPYINEQAYKNFLAVVGIKPFGLNSQELRIIQLLGENGPMALGDLAAATDLEKGALQSDYEIQPRKKMLMNIDGKRRLTQKGHELYRKEFC